MAAYFFVLASGGWTWGAPLGERDPLYLQATTACLIAVVILQIANLLACRSEDAPLVVRGLRRNPLLFAGLAVELVLLLALVYTPAGNALFACAPPPPWVWLVPLPFAAALLLLETARKAILRGLRRAAA